MIIVVEISIKLIFRTLGLSVNDIFLKFYVIFFLFNYFSFIFIKINKLSDYYKNLEKNKKLTKNKIE